MKFLCDSCKAKYQIPDEKIAGRTLRMKCRKCTKEIIIRGPKGAEPRRRPKSSAGRRRPSGAVSRPSQRPSSALGADFRRAGSTVPEPAPAKTATEWYVAINDVPVGPVKREEVARKIGMGAVTAESLCWREGLDDWRPVKDVPELFALVKQRRVPAPPPVAGRTSGRPTAPPSPERSNVIPIGGRGGAAVAPILDDFEEDEKTVMAPMPVAMEQPPAPPPPAAAAVASSPVAPASAAPDPFAAPAAPALAPAASSATAAPSRMNPGLLIALVGSAAFGIALAVVVTQKMLADPPEVATNDAILAPVEDDDPLVEVPIEAPVDLDVPEIDPAIETGDPEDPDPSVEDDTTTLGGGTAMRPRTNTTMTATGTSTTMQTSAEAQALIDRYGGGEADPDLPMIAVPMTSGSSTRMALDNAALTRVVRAPANQRAIQRCYSTAIRGNSNPPALRVNVTIAIGASGTVTRVTTSGGNIGNLTSCIEQNVRRWRFPPSPGGARTNFPLVFSPTG